MEDPFPYRPLEKPDGWVEAFNQPATLGDGDHDSACAWSMPAAFVCVVLIAATGWVYSIWITVLAILAIVVTITVAIVRVCLSDSTHRWQPFEDSIVEQLEQRPESFAWPNADARRQQIVACVAETVANEKPISEPARRALHPNDPLQLLFWGPYDDLSPLTFLFEFERVFDVRALRTQTIADAVNHDRSLLELVERCEQHLDSLGIKTAVAIKKSRWDSITEQIGDAIAWLNLTEGEVLILAVIAVPVLIVVSILVFT